MIEVRVSADSDDAEERVDGSVSLGSSDLELVYDGGDQIVGMRFSGVTIPQGAIISGAYVQFQTDETHSDPTTLTIQGEGVDDALTFESSSGNISSRPRTTAAVAWSPAPWLTVGEAGPDQRTPDLAAVIQEVVDRPGWTSGDALVVIVSGAGERAAESYNGDPAGAPILHIEYTDAGTATPTPTNTPVPPTDTPLPTNTPTIISLTLAAEADARVLEANPDTNYGTIGRLDVDSGPDEESLVRFNVTGVTGPLQNATLRLLVTNGSSDGPAVYGVDNSWAETEVTWNNRPPVTTGVIADIGPVVAGTWAEYDVTAYISGNGAYSFVLLPNGTDGVTFESRETTSPPELVLTFVGTP